MNTTTTFNRDSKKRNRVPLSCVNCRRKKIKCDRTKPRCKVCEAHDDTKCCYFQSDIDLTNDINHTHSGRVDKPVSVDKLTRATPRDGKILTHLQKQANDNARLASSSTTEIIETLKQKIELLEKSFQAKQPVSSIPIENYGNQPLKRLLQKLKVAETEKIQVYGGVNYKTIIQKTLNNTGPLVWMTIVMKDPFASPICKCVSNSSKHTLTDFHKRALLAKSKLIKSAELSNYAEKLNLVDTVIQLLPPQRAIWLFIDRYFRFVYPLFPYLDEETFTHDIERLMGNTREDGIMRTSSATTVHVTQATDLATLGILMIVMMFSYETLCTNTGTIQDGYLTENERYLKTHRPSDKFVKYTQMCLDEFVLLRKCPLTVLQCAMLLREYQKFDGCDCFADSDSQVYTGLLVQMAISMGIHRDSMSEERDISRTYNKTSQLKRKLWYGLISADNYQYMQASAMPLIHPDYYNTELPSLDSYLSNNSDLEMERTCISLMRSRFFIERKMKVLTDLVCKMKVEPSVYDLLDAIDDLFSAVKQKTGTLETILNGDHGGIHYKKVEKVGNFVIYMNALTLVEPILMHILYQFQSLKNHQMCEFIHDKLLCMWMPVLSRIPDLVHASENFFGLGFDLFLVPLVEVFLHKGLIFFASTYLKCNTMLKKMEEVNIGGAKGEIIEATSYFQTHILIDVFHKIYIPALRTLSKKYFYAWRLYTAHLFIFRSFSDESVPSPLSHALFNYIEYMSVAKIKMLCQTTDWREYNSIKKRPVWFLTWQKNMDCFISDDSLEVAAAKTFAPSMAETVCDVPEEMKSIDSAGDSGEAETWFARLYTKFTEKNYPGYQNPNGLITVNPYITAADRRDSTMKYDTPISDVPKQDEYSIPTPRVLAIGDDLRTPDDFFGYVHPCDLERMFATMLADNNSIDDVF